MTCCAAAFLPSFASPGHTAKEIKHAKALNTGVRQA